MPLPDDNVKAYPETSAFLAALKSDGTLVMVQGSDAGDYISIGGDSPAIRTGKAEQAVVNNTTENFAISLDLDSVALPAKFNVKSVTVIPHNGAATPVAVATKWILRLYVHSDRKIDEIIYLSDQTGGAASNVPVIDNTPWAFENEEGNGIILGSISIPNGENDASFTIRVVLA